MSIREVVQGMYTRAYGITLVPVGFRIQRRPRLYGRALELRRRLYHFPALS